jgi:hypothetical protein
MRTQGACLHLQCRFAICLILVLSIGLMSGCATRVAPPPRQLSEPVPVFLLDHGHHSSLVLPGESGGLVRYSYGDWRYYALGQTDLFTGFKALFRKTPGALGRRELPGPQTAANVRSLIRIGIEQLFELRADASDARRLRDDLDNLFNAGLASRIYNAKMDLDFVPHPEPYTLWHNSNLMVARWLGVLGFDVQEERPIGSNWSVVGDRSTHR